MLLFVFENLRINLSFVNLRLLWDQCRCLFAQWCLILCDPVGSTAHQVPLSMGFPRQEYWRGLPFPSPGDLSHPWIEPASPALTGGFFTTSATWEAHYQMFFSIKSSLPLSESIPCALNCAQFTSKQKERKTRHSSHLPQPPQCIRRAM